MLGGCGSAAAAATAATDRAARAASLGVVKVRSKSGQSLVKPLSETAHRRRAYLTISSSPFRASADCSKSLGCCGITSGQEAGLLLLLLPDAWPRSALTTL